MILDASANWPDEPEALLRAVFSALCALPAPAHLVGAADQLEAARRAPEGVSPAVER